MRVLYKVNKFKIFMWMMWINLVYKGWSGLKVLGMRLGDWDKRNVDKC